MHFIMCLPEILASTCMHGCTELCLTFGGSLLKSASMHVLATPEQVCGGV